MDTHIIYVNTYFQRMIPANELLSIKLQTAEKSDWITAEPVGKQLNPGEQPPSWLQLVGEVVQLRERVREGGG